MVGQLLGPAVAVVLGGVASRSPSPRCGGGSSRLQSVNSSPSTIHRHDIPARRPFAAARHRRAGYVSPEPRRHYESARRDHRRARAQPSHLLRSTPRSATTTVKARLSVEVPRVRTAASRPSNGAWRGAPARWTRAWRSDRRRRTPAPSGSRTWPPVATTAPPYLADIDTETACSRVTPGGAVQLHPRPAIEPSRQRSRSTSSPRFGARRPEPPDRLVPDPIHDIDAADPGDWPRHRLGEFAPAPCRRGRPARLLPQRLNPLFAVIQYGLPIYCHIGLDTILGNLVRTRSDARQRGDGPDSHARHQRGGSGIWIIGTSSSSYSLKVHLLHRPASSITSSLHRRRHGHHHYDLPAVAGSSLPPQHLHDLRRTGQHRRRAGRCATASASRTSSGRAAPRPVTTDRAA